MVMITFKYCYHSFFAEYLYLFWDIIQKVVLVSENISYKRMSHEQFAALKEFWLCSYL